MAQVEMFLGKMPKEKELCLYAKIIIFSKRGYTIDIGGRARNLLFSNYDIKLGHKIYYIML